MAHAACMAAPAINDDHPLALELASLRATVSKFQHEAHAASLKLQRHSLESSRALDLARALEHENARLREEVAILRAAPDTPPPHTSQQVPELTLALRRLSDKLTVTEDILFQRTKEAADARSELAGSHYQVEAARALAAEARAREEEGLARERVLERRLKAAEEERRMADLVVQEYADLVRKLEGRPKVPCPPSSVSIDLQRSTNSSATTLVDNLSEGRLGLQRLMEEFNARDERLQSDIAKLHGDNSLLYKELELARHAAEHDRGELANAMHDLDKHRADDNTATKMVSRYMKFSQLSTDTLQRAMDTLRSRHATTLKTLNSEIAQLQGFLLQERAESDRLRSALDELTEDIAREAYGRRREVSLRLAFLGREENLAEHLRRWIRKAREHFERASGESEDDPFSLNPQLMALREVFGETISDAECLFDTLNGQPARENQESSEGSLSRLLLAQDAVISLTCDLQEETVRRLTNERKLAQLEPIERVSRTRELEQTESLEHPVPHRTSDVREENRILATTEDLLTQESPPTDTLETPVIVDVVTVPAVKKSEFVVPVENLPIHSPQLSTKLAELPIVTSPQMPPLVEMPDLPAASESSPLFRAQEDDSINALVVSEPCSLPSVTATISPIVLSGETPNAIPSIGVSSIPCPSSMSPPVPLPAVKSLTSLDMQLPTPLSLETANGSRLSSLSSSAVNSPAPCDNVDSSVLAGLTRVKYRYDNIQRGFRDCYMALRELKKSLTILPSSSPPSSFDMTSVLRKAVERLTDFNEDARVELEIRIADEERIASGYETILSIPGAMTQSDDTQAPKFDGSDVLEDVRAFIDGSDRAVAKATQQFSQKLDDLEHDIASIKRTLHELSMSSESAAESSSSPPDARTGPGTSPSWPSWTSSFLSPARPTSPAPPPTFGSVVTSPRLRHSSSFSHPRERSNDEHLPGERDPLASLGLRIVVPPRSPTYGGGLGVGGATMAPASGESLVTRSAPRQRTTSGMFMLGLGGMRSASLGGARQGGLQKVPSRSALTSMVSTSRFPSNLGPSSSEEEIAVEDSGRGAGNDSDVE